MLGKTGGWDHCGGSGKRTGQLHQLRELDMRYFVHLSIANRVKLANYNAYPHGDPLEDPELSKHCHPSKVNPRVLVLRISDPKDDKPQQLSFCGLTAAKPAPSTAPTSDVTSSKNTSSAAAMPKAMRSRGDALPLLLTRSKAPSPETVTEVDSNGPRTAQQAW